MTLTLQAVWRDMKNLWRGRADGLFAILGVFIFLPAFGQVLFIEPPDIKSIDWNAVQIITDYYSANVIPLLAIRMINLVGGGAMLVLLLMPGQTSPAEAIIRAFRFLPSLFLLSVLLSFFVGAGLFAFIVPGLYFLARAVVVEAAMVTEGISNPFIALSRSLQITAGQGWTVLGLLGVFAIATWIATQLVAVVVGLFGTILLPTDEIRLATGLAGAFASAAFAAVTNLFAAVVYKTRATA